MSLLYVDFHIHLYQEFSAERIRVELAQKVADLTGHTQPPSATPPTFIALLTEGTRERSTGSSKKLLSELSFTQYSAHSGTIEVAPNVIIGVVLANQIITKDRLEVHSTILEDHWVLPLATIIEKHLEQGALLVVPWSPGKWSFSRKEIVRDVIKRFGTKIFFSDSALRPRILPIPELMKEAERSGSRILAGSDPLPRRGDEGTFFSLCTEIILSEEVHKSDSPEQLLLRSLSSPSKMTTVGNGRSFPQIIGSLAPLYLRRAFGV